MQAHQLGYSTNIDMTILLIGFACFPFHQLLISLYRLLPPSIQEYLSTRLNAFCEIKANSSRSFNLQLTQRRIQTGRNKPLVRSFYSYVPHGYETVQLRSATATGL